ncbi:MAG: hypothetical protein AB8I69_08570 [Anaerolineae bacterium]|jgi:hypothetical protein
MSGLSSGKGLSGNQLYIAIAVWLALVLVGSICLYIGYTINPDGDGSKQAATTPTSAVIPTATGASVAQPTFASYPTVESTEEVFGYGIAIHGLGGDPDYWMQLVEDLGLGWAKQQVKWKVYEGNPGEMDWAGFDRVVEYAKKHNLKVMFSVVDAPVWTRSYLDANQEGAPPDDLALYAEFLGRLVDRYKDQGCVRAIEVWNEQNLDREWDTAEGVNATRYVEMLRLSYQAIKSRDPDIIVISGALSPLGGTWTDPNNPERITALDDFVYFDQMVSAGFLNYCDCVGAHHNGYNIPPDITWDEGYQDPTIQHFRGYWDTPHHSWSFKSTLWGYHERIVAAGSDKPLCVTEFGWATTEGFEGHPDVYPKGFEFVLDNTLQEQAEWDVQAFQLMREWGFVRMAFLWNLNYAQFTDGMGGANDNAPYGILDIHGAPRPAFDALGAMEKP